MRATRWAYGCNRELKHWIGKKGMHIADIGSFLIIINIKILLGIERRELTAAIENEGIG